MRQLPSVSVPAAKAGSPRPGLVRPSARLVLLLLLPLLSTSSTVRRGGLPLPAGFSLEDDGVKPFLRAQAGQDKMLWERMFKDSPHFKTGFFIEFGARDGLEHSNTAFFEKALGWRGILLEASPIEHANIVLNRPGSAVLNAAVCEEEGPREFKATDKLGWGGFAKTYDNEDPERNRLATPGRTVSVACLRLSTIVELFGVRHVNYMSVDTEGSELQALRSFPWSSVTVDVVGVEVITGSASRTEKEAAVVSYMQSVDYRLLERFAFSHDTADIFFVPATNATAERPNSERAFSRMKTICQKLQRCLT